MQTINLTAGQISQMVQMRADHISTGFNIVTG